MFVSLKTRTPLVFEYSKYTALKFNYNFLHVRFVSKGMWEVLFIFSVYKHIRTYH